MAKKFILALLLTTVVIFSGLNIQRVSAITTAELEAQIKILQEILQKLIAQYQELLKSKNYGFCGWCGGECVRKTIDMQCADIMPPVGVECKEINSVCTKIPLSSSTSTKKISITSPIAGSTITSNSLVISWNIQGFTGNEGKIRILFYGGGASGTASDWKIIQENLPVASGNYTLNLSNVAIADPSRCSVRVGIYNPNTGNWVTWTEGNYTGQYYADSGHFSIVKSSGATSLNEMLNQLTASLISLLEFLKR